MRLADVLAAHDAYRPFTALPDNLGDGFLYCANPIFRAVRDRATAAGVRFTTDDFCGYRVAPLAALGPILRARKIPYTDNVGVLRASERKRPGGALANVMPIKPNVVLHEAAHCVADRVLGSPRGLTKARTIALRSALGESFANACEVLGMAAATTRAHRYFYDQNSFTSVSPRMQEALAQTVDQIGWAATARTAFLSFVLANTMSKTISDETCARVWDLAGAGAPARKKDRGAIEVVTRVGLTLNLKFRMETAAFFMRYEHGIEQDVFRLNDYDVLAVFERDRALRGSMDELCAILAGAS
jgi:hypothetical protein